MGENFLVPILFLLVSTSVLFLSLLVTKRSRRTNGKLPPGPWRLPLIGSIHHLTGAALPHRRFRELSQKYGPLMYLQLGEIPTVVVSSPEAAKEILKTHDSIFAQRPRIPSADVVVYGSANITLSPMGRYWKLMRKWFSLELAGSKRVRSFKPLMREHASSLVRSLSAKAEEASCVNLSEEIFTTICTITTKAAFGEKFEGEEALFSVTKELLTSAEEINVSDLFPSRKWLQVITGTKRKLEELRRKTDVVLEDIIARVTKAHSNNRDHGDDVESEFLLSALLKLKDRGDLTMDNVKAVMLVSTNVRAFAFVILLIIVKMSQWLEDQI